MRSFGPGRVLTEHITVREHAQNVRASKLLDKIAEFERENAKELAQMTSWNESSVFEDNQL